MKDKQRKAFIDAHKDEIDKAMSRMTDEEAAAFLSGFLPDDFLRKNSARISEEEWKEMTELAEELKKYV